MQASTQANMLACLHACMQAWRQLHEGCRRLRATLTLSIASKCMPEARHRIAGSRKVVEVACKQGYFATIIQPCNCVRKLRTSAFWLKPELTQDGGSAGTCLSSYSSCIQLPASSCDKQVARIFFGCNATINTYSLSTEYMSLGLNLDGVDILRCRLKCSLHRLKRQLYA